MLNGGPGKDRIVCGPGRDTVMAELRDVVARDCEFKVTVGTRPRRPRRPPPPRHPLRLRLLHRLRRRAQEGSFGLREHGWQRQLRRRR